MGVDLYYGATNGDTFWPHNHIIIIVIIIIIINGTDKSSSFHTKSTLYHQTAWQQVKAIYNNPVQ
jgi:hypothetical protein